MQVDEGQPDKDRQTGDDKSRGVHHRQVQLHSMWIYLAMLL